MTKGETDTRLDKAAVYLKELVSAVNNMNDNLGAKMDQMFSKQDQMLGKQDELLDEVIRVKVIGTGCVPPMNWRGLALSSF